MGLNKFCIIIIIQAQLFEGQLVHNPGLNLTQASFSFVQINITQG